MTISVGLSEHGTFVGPGSRIAISSDLVGPIPNDDFVYVYLRLDDTGYAVCGGTAVFAGRHLFVMTLGFFEIGSAGIAPQENRADGASVHLHADAYHANGTLWDSGDSASSYTLSSSALWYLLALISSGPGVGLKDVLAAVVRTFPPP